MSKETNIEDNYADILQRYEWFSDNLDVEYFKNLPRHRLVAEIIELHGEVVWLKNKIFELHKLVD